MVPEALPSPEAYELEYTYWPWGKLIEQAVDWVVIYAPRGAVVADYMCGTGYILNRISERRPDLCLFGCNYNPKSYVDYANRVYPSLQITYEDALHYNPPIRPDVALCTGGIHHLKIDDQQRFIEKLSRDMGENGILIVGEEVLPAYETEQQRRNAVVDLWCHLAHSIIGTSGPDIVLETAVGVLRADLFRCGEYKVSRHRLEALLSIRFEIFRSETIWPDPSSDYGDVLIGCRQR